MHNRHTALAFMRNVRVKIGEFCGLYPLFGLLLFLDLQAQGFIILKLSNTEHGQPQRPAQYRPESHFLDTEHVRF